MFQKVIDWSQKEFHHLPWRIKRTPYTTLVSEIMLQQTTVGTVINYFDDFLKKFPTIASLAKAQEDEVLRAWKGLGYYRRVKNLKLACQKIMEEFDSKIPETLEELKSIPGIGDYTAHAILTIGMNKDGIPVDANIERILARLFLIKENKGSKLQKVIKDKYQNNEILIDRKSYQPRELYEALMDLGRSFCLAKKVNCKECPLNKNCMAFKLGEPLSIPFEKEEKPKEKIKLELLRVVLKNKGQVLAIKRKKGQWLEGQIELPTFLIEHEGKDFDQYPLLKKSILNYKKLPMIKTTITKYQITNYLLEVNEKKLIKELGLNIKSKEHFFIDRFSKDFSTATIKAFKKLKFD